MYGFLEERVRRTVQNGDYKELSGILLLILLVYSGRAFGSAYIVQWIWNTTVCSFHPYVLPLSVYDVLLLRIAYSAFLLIS